MTVTPLPPLTPTPIPEADRSLGSVAYGALPPTAAFADAFAGTLAAASSALERADRAESAFVHGRGGIQEMVVERAQADIVLTVASTAASRTAQSLSTLLNMQV